MSYEGEVGGLSPVSVAKLEEIENFYVEGQVGRVGRRDSLYYRAQVEQGGMEGDLWWV